MDGDGGGREGAAEVVVAAPEVEGGPVEGGVGDYAGFVEGDEVPEEPERGGR